MEDAWVDGLRDSLQAKRDGLWPSPLIGQPRFRVLGSSGTYFLCADPRPLGFDDGTAFCSELPHRAGVAAILMSAFCDPGGTPDAWRHLVRFAFCKRDETLDEGDPATAGFQPS